MVRKTMSGADTNSGPSSDPPPLILVVEDEPLVRLITSEILIDAGFQVIEAAHAEQALAILEQAPVALVLTDVDMPGELDGLALRGVLRERAPGLPVIVTSGGVRLGALQPHLGGPFIAKPFTADALIATVTTYLTPGAATED
ncbi:hypothetical protein BH10PSE3_BH10PSE3_17660 [soil metagenome]